MAADDKKKENKKGKATTILMTLKNGMDKLTRITQANYYVRFSPPYPLEGNFPLEGMILSRYGQAYFCSKKLFYMPTAEYIKCISHYFESFMFELELCIACGRWKTRRTIG